MTNIVKVENTTQVTTVSNLAKEIWQQHYTPIIGEAQVTYMIDNFQSFDRINTEIFSGEALYFLTLEDEIPIGYCAIKPEEYCMFLSKLYVKEEYRKMGIARKMFHHVIEQSIGKSYIYLTVNKHNTGSINAYEKLGFINTDSIVTDIGNGFVMDDYVMKYYL